ncbi:leucine rich repeat protein, putative [Eimeria necatrix]|uniref:Leucine rich repeat protein, putative n=1 Tax=Eimeria necatrix TaxID=51315 RepID=U6N579_9EIME|nr:leucine rich repeat protein, putative [Eimeria necatrix]CDJ70454.1 leucine rich repeat protein, putative [Eimeria necatrix]
MAEMTCEALSALLREKPKVYYRTAALNSVLYVHRRGFSSLGGLEGFSGLKALYADGNGLCCCSKP